MQQSPTQQHSVEEACKDIARCMIATMHYLANATVYLCECACSTKSTSFSDSKLLIFRSLEVFTATDCFAPTGTVVLCTYAIEAWLYASSSHFTCGRLAKMDVLMCHKFAEAITVFIKHYKWLLDSYVIVSVSRIFF